MKWFLGSFSSFRWFKKSCCQLQANYVHEVLANSLVKLAQESVVRWTDVLDMNIADVWDIKNQPKPKLKRSCFENVDISDEYWTQKSLLVLIVQLENKLYLHNVKKKCPVEKNKFMLLKMSNELNTAHLAHFLLKYALFLLSYLQQILH